MTRLVDRKRLDSAQKAELARLRDKYNSASIVDADTPAPPVMYKTVDEPAFEEEDNDVLFFRRLFDTAGRIAYNRDGDIEGIVEANVPPRRPGYSTERAKNPIRADNAYRGYRKLR